MKLAVERKRVEKIERRNPTEKQSMNPFSRVW